MRIGGLTDWKSTGSTGTAGPAVPARPPSAEQAARRNDIENARSTAISALHNDRFRSMLTRIGDPGFGDTLMRVGSAEAGADASLSTVQARYAENSE
jgi:hypothetical protein